MWSVGLLGLRQVCFFDPWGCFVASPACSVIAVTSCGLRALASRCHSSSHCHTVCFLHSVDGRPRVSDVTVSTWAWRPGLWGEPEGQVSLNLPLETVLSSLRPLLSPGLPDKRINDYTSKQKQTKGSLQSCSPSRVRLDNHFFVAHFRWIFPSPLR